MTNYQKFSFSSIMMVSLLFFNNCSSSSEPSEEGDPQSDWILSINLKVWEKKTDHSFKGHSIASDPSVIKVNGIYYLYYTELDTSTSRTYIALATSTDKKSWKLISSTLGLPGAVLVGETGSWSENLEAAEAIYQNGTIYLYFSGYSDVPGPELNIKGFPASLGLATSTDFENFELAQEDPIIEPTANWYDHHAVTSPSVIYDGEFKMIYAGHCYETIYCTGFSGTLGNRLIGATSTDGVNWTKVSEPILHPDSSLAWMDWGAAEPSFVWVDGKYKMIFTGLHDQERVLGYAEAVTFEGLWEVYERPVLEPTPGSNIDSIGVLAPTLLIENQNASMWYLGYSSFGSGFTIGHSISSLSPD